MNESNLIVLNIIQNQYLREEKIELFFIPSVQYHKMNQNRTVVEHFNQFQVKSDKLKSVHYHTSIKIHLFVNIGIKCILRLRLLYEDNVQLNQKNLRTKLKYKCSTAKFTGKSVSKVFFEHLYNPKVRFTSALWSWTLSIRKP